MRTRRRAGKEGIDRPRQMKEGVDEEGKEE